MNEDIYLDQIKQQANRINVLTAKVKQHEATISSLRRKLTAIRAVAGGSARKRLTAKQRRRR